MMKGEGWNSPCICRAFDSDSLAVTAPMLLAIGYLTFRGQRRGLETDILTLKLFHMQSSVDQHVLQIFIALLSFGQQYKHYCEMFSFYSPNIENSVEFILYILITCPIQTMYLVLEELGRDRFHCITPFCMS